MIQSNIEGNIKYCNNSISYNMENNGSASEGPSERSSKPKSTIAKNETNPSRGDGEQAIGIGYPVDEAEFKVLKDKSKLEMNKDDDSCQPADLSNEDENR